MAAARVVAPPYITSLTLTRASASARFAYATRRDGNAVTRSDQTQVPETLTRVRPSAHTTRHTYQWPASCPVDVILELRARESLSVPMAISDLETNDRSTNNGYAFFRDVPKWSRSAVPHARPVRPSLSPRTNATSDAPTRRTQARQLRTPQRRLTAFRSL